MNLKMQFIDFVFLFFFFSGEIPNDDEVLDGPIPWCKSNQLTFLAEQVSHHPPSEFISLLFSSIFGGDRSVTIVMM